MIDLKFGGAFCVLPWIEEYRGASGDTGFCCDSKPFSESDDPNLLRKEIWNGNKTHHCNYCYDLESAKIVSSRQKESVLWLKTIGDHFKQKECPDQKILFYDIRIDNKCNLACISCNPKNSSLWSKELDIPIKNLKEQFDYEKLKKAKKIYLAGGEPLIIEKYLNLIKEISINNPHIELVINTNLTNLPEDILKCFEKIHSVNLTISIDAYGKVNEYHRYPLKWSKFITNLDKIKNSNCSLNFNTVVDAVSVFGMEKFKNLENYVSSWNLSVLSYPISLKINNLPKKLKPIAVNNIKKLKEIKFYKNDILFKNRVDGLIKEIEKDGDSQLLVNYITELDKRRNINHQDYLGVSLI